MKKYTFELLIITNNKTDITTEKGISYLIGTNNKLEEFNIKKDCVTFKYKDETFIMKVQKPKINISKELVFSIKIYSNESDLKNSKIENIEQLRKLITNKLKNDFSKIYVVKDEISQYLCKESYKYINSVENKLREFILRFMITKIGSGWFEYVVTDSGINKANSRNENKQLPFISDDINNIDFKDLSEIIFNNHTHYKSKNDILKELRECTTIEEFEAVKEKAISNWDNYFNEFFDENWKDEWYELSKYRNMVAHNKIISLESVNKLKKLSDFLSDKIENAIDQLKNFQYTEDESKSISEQLENVANETFKHIMPVEYQIDPEELRKIIAEYQADSKGVKKMMEEYQIDFEKVK